MLDQHLLRIANRREVVGAVPALHLGQIFQQLCHGARVGVQLQLLACASKAAGHIGAGLIGAAFVLRTAVFALGAARRADGIAFVLRTAVFALGAARRAHAACLREP
ncbi:hypothetical protein D9M68_606220 [compost metagenome]